MNWLKPYVGAEQAAQTLGVSQQRLRQLVDERKLAVLRLGPRTVAYPTAELRRLRAERDEDARSTLVAELQETPAQPLPRIHDQVLTLDLQEWVDETRDFHVRTWASEGLRVVLISPCGNHLNVGRNRLDMIMTEIDERLLGGSGTEAVWFTADYPPHADSWPPVTSLEVDNVVARAAAVRPGDLGGRRRPARFSGLTWRTSSLQEVARLVGSAITVFPFHANTAHEIEYYARTGRPKQVTYDWAEVGGLLEAFRTVTSTARDGGSTLASQVAAVLARSTLDRAQFLESQIEVGGWSDGAMLDEPAAQMGAVLRPRQLTPADHDLLAAAVELSPLEEAGDLEGLYLQIRGWQEQVDELSGHPNRALTAALEQAADVVVWGLRREAYSQAPAGSEAVRARLDDVTRFAAYPRRRQRHFDVIGPWDRRYLDSLTPTSPDASHEARELVAIAQRWTDLIGVEWSYGRDADGFLVAMTAAGERKQAEFIVLWPIDPPAAGMPDESAVGADGAPGDRPAYLSYPDGSVRLLPCRPGPGQWNFGYGGGGPNELAWAIADAYAQARQLKPADVPRDWILDAVSHSDEDTLHLRISDITRRVVDARPADNSGE